MPLESICVTTLDELAEHESRWELLRQTCGGSTCTSHSLSASWLESFSGTVKPRVILVEEGGSLVGVAPLATRDYRVSGLRVRSSSFIGDIPGKLGFSDLRILCLPGRPDVVEEMIKKIGKGEWNTLRMSLLEDTEADRFLLARSRALWDCQEVPEAMLTKIDLRSHGGTDEQNGRPHGEALEKRVRKLEKDDRLVFKAIPPAEVGRAVRLYADHHVQRWRARGGSMFEDPENVLFLERSMDIAFLRGFGHAYELLVDGSVAAQCFGFTEGTRALGFRMGMNPALAKYSPGIILGKKFLEEMRAQGVEEVSLGYGSEDYKRNFGARESPLLGIQARRGWLSFMAKLSDSPPVRYADRALGIKQRLFGTLYQ